MIARLSLIGLPAVAPPGRQDAHAFRVSGHRSAALCVPAVRARGSTRFTVLPVRAGVRNGTPPQAIRDRHERRPDALVSGFEGLAISTASPRFRKRPMRNGCAG